MAAIKQLPASELSEFARRFQAWQGEKPKTGDEVLWLARIDEYSRLPSGEQERYERLRAKCENRTLEAEELTEYQALLQALEARNVQRVEALLALAERRGVSPQALVDELYRTGGTDDD